MLCRGTISAAFLGRRWTLPLPQILQLQRITHTYTHTHARTTMRPLCLCAISLLVGLVHPAAALPVSAPDTSMTLEASPNQRSGQDDNKSVLSSSAPSRPAGDDSQSSEPDTPRISQGGDGDSQVVTGHTSPPGEGNADLGRPRAIVNVRRNYLSGEASYIIHPDNQPPPRFEPLKDLPPPTRPVAKWNSDIFMKICCSDPELDEGSGDAPEGVVTLPASQEDEDEDEATEQPPASPDQGDQNTKVKEVSVESAGEGSITTATPEEVSSPSTTHTSSDSELENTLAPINSSEAHPESTSNYTPRYEEASITPYQDVTNFLRDIANSDGFQNVFIGDLIRNFGSLDQNALKLMYSLLIGPLEGSYKEDRVGTVEDDPLGESVPLEDSVLLTRDRLPLRDRPENGFQPLKTSFLQSRPSEGSTFPIRPSFPVQPVRNNDEMWRPGRIYDKTQPVNRRGEERVDVITAPPTKTFEVVLGSSLTHDTKEQRIGGSLKRPASQGSHSPLPFDKLTLGLEMPPPDALDALPPGSILIPPSHILGRPNLPKILPPRGGGAPTLEMPIVDFLPNLPFLTNPTRHRPPAHPKVKDIPPRLPGFLPSRRPTPPNPVSARPPRLAMQPRPAMKPRPALQPLRREEAGLHFSFTRQPTGPPPIVTKMTSPTVPIMPAPHRPFRHPHRISSSVSLSPYLTPPPPRPASPPPSPPSSQPPPPPPPPPRTVTVNKEEHDHSHAHTPVNVKGFSAFDDFGNDRLADYMSDRNEDYRGRPQGHRHHPPHADYYSEVPPDYFNNYYNIDYDEYYHDRRNRAKQEQSSDDLAHLEHHLFIQEASATFPAANKPRKPSHAPTINTTPASINENLTGGGQSEESLPSLDDLLGVVKPNFSTPATTKQDSNKINSLLQNHQPASTPPEDNKDGTVTPEQTQDTTTHRPQPPVKDNVALTSIDFGARLKPHQVMQGGHEPSKLEEFPAPSEDEHREHDASISHLWKNLQLIPLTPDLFVTPRQPKDRVDLNLTSLFDVDAAVPLAPGDALDLAPDLSSDVNKISVDHNGVRVTVREEVFENPEKAEAKFMAYVLIGACCGLALLSITGVIVIVRFKKTCGSRQIKTRTRLTEQDSVENISRHVSQLTPAKESGHKLGSWFTGRNEHIGSGKLRGNMALPTVHDHKREKKGHSSSTRDLLSISSQSSPSNSPRQERRDNETGGCAGEEEPRTSWLHGEYRATEDELSHAAALDPHYRAQHQHQHQQARGSVVTSSSRHHSTDHHAHRDDSAGEVDSPSRTTRERRYTGQSRDSNRHPRTTSGRGSRYIPSFDSEELEDRLGSHAREYPTDSELDDGTTTHYDEESREPSRYFSDSRELDDVIGGRRGGDHSSMTSQELGEHISRDLKQYQAHQESRTHHQRHSEELQHPRDAAGLAELSSQELDSEESRELRRSQSQVSFSRDNVQNEVFLEFDSMLRQQGQYLGSDPLASTLGRASLFTNDTRLSASRANTPDSIDLPEDFSQDSRTRRECDHPPPSPPTTPPRFSPPPAPPRPPKPGHLSQAGTPSPQAGRGRPPSPGQSPPSPSSSSQRPVYWTSEEERLI